MGLTRPITRELTQILPRQLWQGLGLGKVEQILLDARAALNIHPEQQVGATYLAEQTPTIAGVVEDETPTHKDRTRLSCRASDFDGINQRFYSSGRVTSSAKTQLSVSVWVRPTLIDASRGIIAEYDAGANEQSWLMYHNSSGQLIVSISENGSAAGKTFFTANNTFVVNEWCHVCFTFDGTQTGGDLTLFLNGKEITPTITSPNSSVESLFDTTTDLQIGAITDGANLQDGQIQQPLIYEGVWTPAEVRDIYLQQTDASITYGWFLDGDTAHPLTSASPTLTPANSPSLYEDDTASDWLNEKGWNFGNRGRFKNLFTTGDEITFLIKADPAETKFVFLSGDLSSKYAVVWQQGLVSNGLIDAAAVTIDGVRYTVRNAGDLYTDIADGQEHTVTIELDGVSDWTFFEWGNYTFSSDWLLDEVGYIRPTHINGVPITADDIDFDNTTVLAPKRWDEELDSDGAAATDSTSFGAARRNGQLRGDSNAVQLDGINQYGVITNTDDFSASDWTLSGYFTTETLVGNKALFAQLDGSGTGETWLRTANTTGIFQTELGGTTAAFNSVTAASIGVDYYFTLTHDATANELTLSVTDLDLSTTTSETISKTMVAATGNFNFGSNKTPADFFNGPIWGFKLDHANGFEIPMSEKTGDISYDVSGNEKHCTWVNSPERVDQDSYHWNEAEGYSLYEHASEPDLFVPLKSDGTALTITPPSGYTKTSDNPAGPWLYEGDATYVDFDVVANANQWLEQRWIGAEFDGTLNSNINADTAITGYPFSISADIYPLSQSLTYLSLSSSTTNYFAIQQVSLDRFAVMRRDATSGEQLQISTSETFTQNTWAKIEVVFNSSSSITMIFDGRSETFNSLTEVALSSTPSLYVAQLRSLLGQSPDFDIKNVVVKQGTTSTNDQPLLGTSLDLSDNLFHGTDTDNNYIRLTDTSYTAGDVVEQPFSVNDDTSGRVSELIQFTFPITTLSSTPTISQTVFEDGNTVTQDGILISES